MKLTKLDPTPAIIHGWHVEIRILAPTNHKPARIRALVDTGINGNRRTMTQPLDCGDTTEQIKNLVVALIEKHDLHFLRNSVGKMSLSTTKKGWIVSLPIF